MYTLFQTFFAKVQCNIYEMMNFSNIFVKYIHESNMEKFGDPHFQIVSFLHFVSCI